MTIAPDAIKDGVNTQEHTVLRGRVGWRWAGDRRRRRETRWGGGRGLSGSRRSDFLPQQEYLRLHGLLMAFLWCAALPVSLSSPRPASLPVTPSSSPSVVLFVSLPAAISRVNFFGRFPLICFSLALLFSLCPPPITRLSYPALHCRFSSFLSFFAITPPISRPDSTQLLSRPETPAKVDESNLDSHSDIFWTFKKYFHAQLI